MKISSVPCSLILLFIVSGCWDRTEINDMGFIMGTSIDQTKSKKLLMTVQIAVPGEGGISNGQADQPKKSFILSAIGENDSDVINNLQKQSSRKLFTAHRSVIFIGEELAKEGIGDCLDYFTHDPSNRMRTFIMVVKGEAAHQVFKSDYPYELTSAEAVKEMENSKSELSLTLKDYYLSTLNEDEGIYPVMGVLARNRNSINSTQMYKLDGSAIFEHNRLVGYLNEKETDAFMWITNQKIKHERVIAKLPEGKGNVGIVITKMNRRIIPEIRGNQINYKIIIYATANLTENNSQLNIRKLENLQLIDESLEQTMNKQMEEFLEKIQNDYKVDCIGLGQILYHRNPAQWKRLKRQWENVFPKIDVTTNVNLEIQGTGMSSVPFQNPE